MEQSFHGDWTFSAEYVASNVSMQDSFCKCLQHVFDKEKVRYVAEMYGIGCFGIDDTMFPVMDADLNVHNIKIQHYDTNPLSSGFFHKDHGKAWWYGKKYMETHPDKGDTFCDVQCYFGEHLISRYPSAIIVLVESPKNAILGTCLWPQYLWVAAGNKRICSPVLVSSVSVAEASSSCSMLMPSRSGAPSSMACVTLPPSSSPP
ncbi:MAG: hypothetical protein J5663_07675 [Bacteroidaceae bacterium]|nr:hypothetical protein [Bacteroidaceae bacterium]